MQRPALLIAAVLSALLALGSGALAQIGEPVEALLDSLPQELTAADGSYSLGGLTFTPEERGELLYRVAAQGTMNEANAAFSADLVGAVTGYGEQIAEPVRDFFGAQLTELAGRGEVVIDVQQYKMAIEVTGEEPFDVAFSVYIEEIPADAFPVATHSLGPEDANYVVREFSDFQCPFCARFASSAVPLIKEELLTRGDVRFEFHHFPLETLHANALSAAEASECVSAANTPDAFWPYHDALFERQQAWSDLSEPTDYYVRLAEDLGLETGGVEACLDNREFAEQIRAAAADLPQRLGVGGTPSVFINGYKLAEYTQLESYLSLMDLSDKFSATP